MPAPTPNHSTSDGIVLEAVLVVALVALNGLFVAAEFALVKIRDTQLDPLVNKGHRRAGVARSILQRLDEYLGAAQLGITMTSLGLGWVGEPLFAGLLSPLLGLLHITSEDARHAISFTVGFMALTFVHICVGEQAPKLIAIRHPVSVSLWIADPLRWFYLALYPFNWVLNHSARWLLRQVGIEFQEGGHHGHSEEELRLLLGSSQKQATGVKLGRDLVLNALDLRRRLAREVMRPRQEITVFDTTATIAQCMEVAEKSRYSRFPLCEEGDLDRTLGVIHIKDLYAMRLKARTGADLAPVVRKLVYVPETARLEKLLQLFLERKLHLAIVVDEYGGTLGMVTLENILEEIVGQIQDEFDQELPHLVPSSATSWEVAGATPLHTLEDLVGEPLREEGINTVSGWVTHRLGGFPKKGDLLVVGSCELRVEEMDGMKVARLHLTKRPPPETTAT